MRTNRILPLLLIALASIATASRAAEASIYRWHTAVSGNWNDPANWTLESGPAGAGYPNGSGDVALINAGTPFGYTVTIPDGVTVTVGRLVIAPGSSSAIVGIGSALLVME